MKNTFGTGTRVDGISNKRYMNITIKVGILDLPVL